MVPNWYNATDIAIWWLNPILMALNIQTSNMKLNWVNLNSFLEQSLIGSHELHCDKHGCSLHTLVCVDSPLHEFEGQSRFLVLFPLPHVFEQCDHAPHESNLQNRCSPIQDSTLLSSWPKAGCSFRQSVLSTCLFWRIQLRVTIFSPAPQVSEHEPLVQSSQNGQLSSEINACIFCTLAEQIEICIKFSSCTFWIRRS